MENPVQREAGAVAAISRLWHWSITPPQSYLAYVVCLALVLGLSFYASTLKPKRPPAVAPPAAAAPRG